MNLKPIKKEKRLILANWKMNGNIHENEKRLKKLKYSSFPPDREVGVCLPFPYLYQAANLLSGSQVSWGGQDISAFNQFSGSYTGEVSAAMLMEFSCHWVILGHSERRIMLKETNTLIKKKIDIALSVGLTPVVCIGESLIDRKAGQTMHVIKRQLKSICSLNLTSSAIVIAYEPLWAIGKGIAAKPEQVQEIHASIRNLVPIRGIRILYGGSVNSLNSTDLFCMPDVDGVLVGRSSLCAEEFLKIVNY